jgi:hypothetical protein
MRQLNRDQPLLACRRCPKCHKCLGLLHHVLVPAVPEIIHFLQHLELQELLVRRMVDHLVPVIIHTDLQLLDLHFVLDQEHLFVLVRQERRDLQVCVHQWAPDLHPNLVTVPHHLHVQAELVVGATHLQQVRLIEVVLQQLPVPVVRVQVVQVAVPVVDVQAVQAADALVARRADQDKDRSQRKLVAKRSIIYAHHH